MKVLPLETINFIFIRDCFLRIKLWRQSGDMELRKRKNYVISIYALIDALKF